jgi:ATP-binding cassette subfamily D (ALD) long-chain fatty acid import protein
LITISTRASLKKYHTYTLTLGVDSDAEWEFQRIGTASEKSSVEKELAELRERLAKVEMWKKKKSEIEEELGRVWVEGGEELEVPEYLGDEVERDVEEEAGDEEQEDGEDDANEEREEDTVHSETESVAASEQQHHSI